MKPNPNELLKVISDRTEATCAAVTGELRREAADLWAGALRVCRCSERDAAVKALKELCALPDRVDCDDLKAELADYAESLPVKGGPSVRREPELFFTSTARGAHQ
jgi:hypothetical protein